MKRWVLNQDRFFYVALAGAVIGAAIELIAHVLSGGDSYWMVRVLRLVAALAIFVVALFLLRIGRDMERIDRAVEMKRKEPGSTIEDEERYEQALKEDEYWGGRVFPNFVSALFFLVVALVLLFTSSFPL